MLNSAVLPQELFDSILNYAINGSLDVCWNCKPTLVVELECKMSELVINLLYQSGLPENISHKLYRKFYLA